MATRAQQMEFLAAGVIKDGATIALPYAVFYAAGTTTTKDAYADIDKAVAITKKALDAQGRAIVYGDGIYKIRIYSGDPDAGGIFTGIEIDGYKVTASTGNARTITGDTTGTVDDGLVLVNTTSGNVSYTLPPAAEMIGHTLTIKKTVAANILTYIAADGENIDGNASGSLIDQNATVQLISDGVNWYGAEIVGTATTLGGFSASETAVAGTIPVYNVDADLVGDITGNAPTATTCTGNAGTVTNGVYTTGNQTINGIKTFASTIVGTINAAIGSLFGTQFAAGKNSQTSQDTAALKAYSNTGDVYIGLHAVGSSAANLKHIRGGAGLVVVGSDGTTAAPLAASSFTGDLLTANVMPAIAAASVGGVGTYALLHDTQARATTPGTTRAGSELRYGSTLANATDVGYGPTAPAGTWTCAGHTGIADGTDASTDVTIRTTLWWRSA